MYKILSQMLEQAVRNHASDSWTVDDLHFDSSVQVSLHGGQVLSWRNERGEELLFTSSKVHSN